MSRCYIHVDDFGLTPSINTGIMRSHEEGPVNSMSIIPNGYAFEEAVSWYRQHEVSLAAHLNFLEGKPLSGLTNPHFTDDDGDFHHGFFYHFMKAPLLKGKEKADYLFFLSTEMQAQIMQVKDILKPGSLLRIDSHQHLHMIPEWFSVLLHLTRETGADLVRIPREKWQWPVSLRSFSHTLGMNNLKWNLLQWLTKVNLPKATGIIETNYEFCGILHTGKMTAPVAMQAILKQQKQVLEILFHPGGANTSEMVYWKKYPALGRYYTAPARNKELEALIQLKQLLD